MMKLRQLEIELEEVLKFKNPKVYLEQYMTPPHLAACLLHMADSKFHDIYGKTVLDIGCGSGILSCGASLLGADYTLGVDIDEDALTLFRENCSMLVPSNSVECLQCDIRQYMTNKSFRTSFDVIFMNPPYGTKNNKGIDMEFLEAATNMFKTAIYSLHKTSTRKYVCKRAKSMGLDASVQAELRYNLDATFTFHKVKSKDIEVDFIRFTPTKQTVK
uniref:Methyltransferase-like protein 5 n=1 Tax=Phallusia mammillata TaxID=59560 RepID=A0A6F9DJY4_9ASCI|nr:methyltransferase-like protein 5 [Phallusia mammillata]